MVIPDTYTLSNDVVANPVKYGFTNVTATACANNAFGGSSIVCNSTNVVAGSTQYAFADHVLQSNEGDSYPAHIYLIAATSG